MPVGEVDHNHTETASIPDARKVAILEAVVEEYIQTGKPVGSGTIAKLASVDVSPATVRNEMAALEAEGYLVAPHTSAGRIPTDRGYRLFVDGITQGGRAKLGRAKSEKVSDFFATTHGEIERMLRDTSRLLSSVTNHAAMVVTDNDTASGVCSAQLVGLSDDVMLAVFVLSDGSVNKFKVDRTPAMTDTVLDLAGRELRSELDGKPLADAGSVPDAGERAELSAASDDRHRAVASARTAVADAVGAALGAAPLSQNLELFVDGTARMASDFEAIDTVREVLAILEQQLVVVTLVQDVLGRGRQVAIGTETGMDPLAECALVVAPYHVGGEKLGSIGVLGPTRMDYSQALAAVAIVSRGLGDRLANG